MMFEIANPKRKIVRTKEEFIEFIKLNNGVSNLYRTVYDFKYLKSKFQIDYESAIINQMFFDCDSEKSLEVIKKFYNYLDANNLSYYMKMSSFHKFPKFQIYVLCKEESLNFKKSALMNGMVYLANEIGLTYGESSSCDLDKATFGDLARICPIAGTYKPKRKSFTCYISKEDLNDIDKLKELSQNGNSKRIIYNKELFSLKKFDYINTSIQSSTDNIIVEVDDFDMEFNDKLIDNLPPFIKKVLSNYKNYCDDYKNRWRVALYLRDIGFPESLTTKICQEYYSKYLNFKTLNGKGTQWDRFVKCKALWYTYHGEFREFPTVQNLLDEGWEITKEDEEAVNNLYGK